MDATGVLRIGFLGPQGSYTHDAALILARQLTDRMSLPSCSRAAFEVVPCETIPAVIASVATSSPSSGHPHSSRTMMAGVVPIENSTEGSVTATLDEFVRIATERAAAAAAAAANAAASQSQDQEQARRTSVKICAELQLPIVHCLVQKRQSETPTLERTVKRVYSHPQALAQCREWLARNLPGAEPVPVASTARAAELCQNEPDAAAICSERCGHLYQLDIAARGIQDLDNNITRFVLFSLQDNVLQAARNLTPRAVLNQPLNPNATSVRRTFLCFSLPHTPGALSDVLVVVKHHHLNMSKIESRPDRSTPWRYTFLLQVDEDLPGATSSDSAPAERLAVAIEEIRASRLCLWLDVLGSAQLALV
ncbi:chorismate mutase/prephenate dehydratase [Capsaspora owczarzaki ATCC 30864]|uniref:prephenate dehydratase n=1 Tax=Capsaspora owczarzaki (strain ATCC 30864) TaxID=595528 RepID=A0A0D2X1W6_CAPO3|nr:chorismate mutase/prephenate dehydratase [Capsaspora owczarzaki ATCC 30864]KJE91524.1 chorismate mutase/prephenate dehydratase [Capsaspora owczarzaki ATCC 30864]|eukprot:XP_004349402.1 chorismate mutase/prephenate dehydratase [Capsaspora owczarzaki ATCC 30864]